MDATTCKFFWKFTSSICSSTLKKCHFSFLDFQKTKQIDAQSGFFIVCRICRHDHSFDCQWLAQCWHHVNFPNQLVHRAIPICSPPSAVCLNSLDCWNGKLDTTAWENELFCNSNLNFQLQIHIFSVVPPDQTFDAANGYCGMFRYAFSFSFNSSAQSKAQIVNFKSKHRMYIWMFD